MSLVLEDVDVVLDGRPIVRDVGLSVGTGERLAVLGPSGSGKSTILRVATGLLRPSRGRVLLDGHDVTGEPPHRRGIGLVFQDAALFPHRDVAGNVGFGPRVAGLPAAEREGRVREALALVGLAGAERRDVATLSGGEAQRVALARALAPRPGVLLLDEPLGALDGPLRERLQTDLRALFEALGLTVVHVTHDVGEAFALGDRVAILRDGRVAQVAPPDELWARPGRRLGRTLPRDAERRGRRRDGDRDPARGGAARARATAPSSSRPSATAPSCGSASGSTTGGELEALATGVDHPRIGDRAAVEVDRRRRRPRARVRRSSAATDDFGEPAPSTRHQRHGGEDHG